MRDRKLVWSAFLVSLLVHAVVMVATWNLALLPVDEVVAAAVEEEEYLELFVLPEEQAASDQPTSFVNVPERLAAEAPENPRHLAMHDSREADLLEGVDEASTPAADLESEFAQVAISRDAGGAGGVEASLLPPQPEPLRSAVVEGENDSEDGEEEAGTLDTESEAGETALATGAEVLEQERSAEALDDPADGLEYFQPDPPSILAPGVENPQQGRPGDRGFEFDQIETGQPGANVRINDTFSLSTTAWDFAPWMQRFSQNLRRNLIVPPAWYLGVVYGQTVVEMTVERDGTASYLEVAERDGHDSLHQASLAAFYAFHPFDPLPPDFPEETLGIRYTIIYPSIHELREQRQRAGGGRRGRRPPGR